jgi:hypothetical protein
VSDPIHSAAGVTAEPESDRVVVRHRRGETVFRVVRQCPDEVAIHIAVAAVPEPYAVARLDGSAVKIQTQATRRYPIVRAACEAWFASDRRPVRSRWYVTTHAIDRYVERFEPLWTGEQARAELEAVSAWATEVGPLTSGDDLYRDPLSPRVGYVVRNDTRMGLPSLMTVFAADVARRNLLRRREK